MQYVITVITVLLLVGCASSAKNVRHCSSANTYYSYSQINIKNPTQPVNAVNMSQSQLVIQNSSVTPVSHTVKAGETLWGISKLYDIDVVSLAKANSITNSKRIEIGQILTVPNKKYIPKSLISRSFLKSTHFIWPVKGDIIVPFGEKIENSINKGVNISSTEGADVLAAKAGKVVFCDSHLKGFGQTVIIDHMDGFQTVYSYNSEILVKVGDIVAQRSVIARVGSSGRAKNPTLHFEIRKNGEPKNPEAYLPR